MDAWRGLACLAVTVYHASAFATPQVDSGGIGQQLAERCLQVVHHFWLGVPVFFAISGYCISATVDSTRRRGASRANYFYRRFRRIYPPYWALLALAVTGIAAVEQFVLPGLFTDRPANFPSPSSLTPSQWLGGVTLTETWRPHVAGSSSKLLFLGPAWTLCYEEQFYLVAGIVLLIAPKRFFGIVALISLFVFLNTENLNFRPLREHGIDLTQYQVHPSGTFLDGHWLAFAVGVAAYYLLQHASLWDRWVVWGILAAGLAWCLRSWAHFTTSGMTRCHFSALACGVALVALKPWDLQIARAPLLRPLMFCGQMCYSMYLVHFPVVRAVSRLFYLNGVSSPLETLLVVIPVATGLTVVCAWAFFQLVERRFLNTPHAQATRLAQLSDANANETAAAPVIAQSLVGISRS
jgi:peptidoglycan/LPS O-acetylase OafA/YrhL